MHLPEGKPAFSTVLFRCFGADFVTHFELKDGALCSMRTPVHVAGGLCSSFGRLTRIADCSRYSLLKCGPTRSDRCRMSTSFEIAVPPGFNLSNAVCSYGFFIQAPNVWDSQSREFHRPLSGSSTAHFQVSVMQDTDEAATALLVHTTADATQDDFDIIEAQVRRMLRLNAADQLCIAKYQKMDQAAKQEGFGALFRSPTVWEDLIKSMLLCNCGWGRTLQMNKALCREVGGGAFPTPENIVEAGLAKLQASCGLGYRANSILNLAYEVISGDLDLEGLDTCKLSEQDLLKFLMGLPGVGPFTAANMMALLGHYRRIPCDSETVRHLQKAHGLHCCTQATVQADVEQVYGRYAPFQFLAYWHELWRDYEDLVGPFQQLSPEHYHLLTGHSMRKAERFRSPKVLNEVSLDSSSLGPARPSPSAPAAVQTRSQSKSAAQERSQTPDHNSAAQPPAQMPETDSDAHVGAQTHDQTGNSVSAEEAVAQKPSLMDIKVETAAQISQDLTAGGVGQRQAQIESNAQPQAQSPMSPFAQQAEQGLTAGAAAQQEGSADNVGSAAPGMLPEHHEDQKPQLPAPGAGNGAGDVRGSSDTRPDEQTAATPKSAKKRGRSKGSQQHSRKHSRASGP